MRRTSRQRPSGARVAAIVAVAILAVVLPFAMNAFQLTTAVFVVIAAIGALGLGVLTGYAGQISLGHAFFLAVGAYTAAVLGGNDHLSAAIWLPAAGLVAALCGALVGPAALRLRGLYLAIVTIGLVYLGQHIFINVAYISGGPGGRSFPAVAFGSVNLSASADDRAGPIDHNGLYYYLAFILLAWRHGDRLEPDRTHLGRGMAAVRDRRARGGACSASTWRGRRSARSSISSAMAGVAGAMYGSYLGFVTPGPVRARPVRPVRRHDHRRRHGVALGTAARRPVRNGTVLPADRCLRRAAVPGGRNPHVRDSDRRRRRLLLRRAPDRVPAT